YKDIAMRDSEARVLSTFFIWAALTVIVVTAMLAHVEMSNFTGVALGVILAISAGASTSAIWKGGNAASEVESSTEKTKRRMKVDRVLNRLSDQEIEDLRARLIGDSDGETSSLDELIRR